MARIRTVLVLISLVSAAFLLAQCGDTTANPACDDQYCNNHGICAMEDTTPGCNCSAGYVGDRCQYCDTGYHLDGTECVPGVVGCTTGSCSGHGTCDDSSGSAVCTCEQGYEGGNCASCAQGYHAEGNLCLPDSQACTADSCSGNGTCDDTSGSAVCSCHTGYAGDDCSACAQGFHDADGQCLMDGNCEVDTCTGHGSCDDSSGSPVCSCDAGYEGVDCAACASGYHDDNGTCVADQSCQPDSCAGHGTCDDSSGALECTCDAGYGGDNCSACAPGFHDENGTCVQDPTCGPSTCNGHGQCDDSSGVPVCTCDEEYEGDNCTDCAAGYVDWDSACVDDLCDPEPCAISHGVPGTCIQIAADGITCQCDSGYAYQNGICALSCLDGDSDNYGNGPDCLGADCDDSDPTVYLGAAELCDGKDNDCDFSTDEDHPLKNQVCDGVDTDDCPNGTFTCLADGSDVECVNESITDIFETCNNTDDDCDGSTDEDFPVGQACDGVDGDQCPNGTFTCAASGQTVECVNENPIDIQEECNGLDDDCDSQFDEGFPDMDGDGTADCVDPDDDGDGVDEPGDNCEGTYNPDQEDDDGDGLGDFCDPTPFNCADHAYMYNDDPASVTVLGSGGTHDDCVNAMNAWNPPTQSCNVTCIYGYYITNTWSVNDVEVNSYSCCYGDTHYEPCNPCDEDGCNAAADLCPDSNPFHPAARMPNSGKASISTSIRHSVRSIR